MKTAKKKGSAKSTNVQSANQNCVRTTEELESAGSMKTAPIAMWSTVNPNMKMKYIKSWRTSFQNMTRKSVH